jgi:hypothetical protein
MKKLLVMMGCLAAGHCQGCEMTPKMSNSISGHSRMLFARKELISRVGEKDYSTMVRDSCRGEIAQQAMPYKYYELRDSKCLFVTLEDLSMHDNCDCPVPSPKEKTPSPKTEKSFGFDEFDDYNAFNMDCPVPSPKRTPSPKKK